MNGDQLAERAVKYVLVFQCRKCQNRNRCHTKADWDRPPVDCAECGARDWERVEREVLG